jgi:Family of unknown function (DUF5681)
MQNESDDSKGPIDDDPLAASFDDDDEIYDPTSPLYCGRTRPGNDAPREKAEERDPKASAENDDDDAIGYKRPPKKHQFKKGQSGNLRGRPKGSKNLATIIKEALLERKVSMRDRDKSRRVSALEGMILQQTNKGLQGDIKSVSLMLNCYGQYVTGETQALELNDDEKEIIEDYARKLVGKEKK